MQRLTSSTQRGFALVVLAVAGCSSQHQAVRPVTIEPIAVTGATPIIQSESGVTRPPYAFAQADEQLLDDVQRGAFWFLWNSCSPTTGMVVDRSSVDFASAAGVGFQLAALPIGVERGWVSRSEAEGRARTILRALADNPSNRKAGLFYHFLTARDASPVPQDVVSTIDSALLFAGILTASSYFGGEVQRAGDRLVQEADWSFFVEHAPRSHEPFMKGFISLGWKPERYEDPTGPGQLHKYYWADCGDEHRLVCLLAAGAPDPAHAVDPQLYYRLRRPIGTYPGVEPMVYLPWSGALFTSFFAHCFIDYASMGPDDPKAAGVDRRPRVDWWENSRRQVNLHRIKAKEASPKFPNLGENAWGLTACDDAKGYAVPGVYPTPAATDGLLEGVDFAKWEPKDDFGDGTLGCYGAASSIMFEPEAALAAIRHYRRLKAADGSPLVWRQPDRDPAKNSYGFKDAFNAATGYVAKDYVAIDQGPMILAIENARTGRVWKWFGDHPWVREAYQRLHLHPRR